MEQTSTIYAVVRTHEPFTITVGGKPIWVVVEGMHRAEAGKYGYAASVESNVCDLCSKELGGTRHAEEGMIMFVMREVMNGVDTTPKPRGVLLQMSSMCAIEMAVSQVVGGVVRKIERHAKN